jgi:hypothetical protein
MVICVASDPPAGNELVVDGRANAYVNGASFDLMSGAEFAPGGITLVTPAGVARRVADGIAFPRARGHVQVGADRGQRDADHRDVESVQEERAAQHEQQRPRRARSSPTLACWRQRGSEPRGWAR